MQASTYMKYVQEVTQIGDVENPTDEALEASENKMFSLASLLKTIGTVGSTHSRWHSQYSNTTDCHCHGYLCRNHGPIATHSRTYRQGHSRKQAYRYILSLFLSAFAYFA